MSIVWLILIIKIIDQSWPRHSTLSSPSITRGTNSLIVPNCLLSEYIDFLDNKFARDVLEELFTNQHLMRRVSTVVATHIQNEKHFRLLCEHPSLLSKFQQLNIVIELTEGSAPFIASFSFPTAHPSIKPHNRHSSTLSLMHIFSLEEESGS